MSLRGGLFAGFLMVQAKFNTMGKFSYIPALIPIRRRIQRQEDIWFYEIMSGEFPSPAAALP